jgi:hypothetical protein
MYLGAQRGEPRPRAFGCQHVALGLRDLQGPLKSRTLFSGPSR